MNRTHLYFLLILLNFSLHSKAEEPLPDEVKKDNWVYKKCMQHTIKYAMFIKIADIGLYFQDCNAEKSLLDREDKLLRFRYRLNVKRKVFADAAEEFYLKNYTGKFNNSQQPKSAKLGTTEMSELNRFNQAYVDIAEDDFYELWHFRGEKITLSKNSKPLITSENSEFAKKYFHIWFGEIPATKSLKRAFIKSND